MKRPRFLFSSAEVFDVSQKQISRLCGTDPHVNSAKTTDFHHVFLKIDLPIV